MKHKNRYYKYNRFLLEQSNYISNRFSKLFVWRNTDYYFISKIKNHSKTYIGYLHIGSTKIKI